MRDLKSATHVHAPCIDIRGLTVGHFVGDNVNTSVPCDTDFGGKVSQVDTDDALAISKRVLRAPAALTAILMRFE